MKRVRDLVPVVSHRQLNSWEAEGHIKYSVPAAGSGSRRRLSLHDVLSIRMCGIVMEVLQGPHRPGHAGRREPLPKTLLAKASKMTVGELTEWTVISAGPNVIIQAFLGLTDDEKDLAAEIEEHYRAKAARA